MPIVTHAGCEDDIIDNYSNGIIIEIGNPAKIAESIEYALNPVNYKTFIDEIEKERNRFHISYAITITNKLLESILEVKRDTILSKKSQKFNYSR